MPKNIKPVKFTPNSGYTFKIGPRYDNGAQQEVYQQGFSLPLLSFRGAARLAGSLDKTQPPQVFVMQGLSVAGIGGLQAGQYILQPLMDTDETGT